MFAQRIKYEIIQAVKIDKKYIHIYIYDYNYRKM